LVIFGKCLHRLVGFDWRWNWGVYFQVLGILRVNCR
jgi:hypothetical protein